MVREQFADRPLPSDAVGRTGNLTGMIVLDSAGAIVPEQSKITMDLTSLRSNSGRRDEYLRNETFQTNRFPTAEFVPRQATGLPNPLPTGGEATFQLIGDLTLAGVARRVTWETTALFSPPEVTGTAKTRVTITEFDMPMPRLAQLLSIDDDARLEMDFRASRN